MRIHLLAAVFLSFAVNAAFGQSGPLILGVDYDRPPAFRAAPGQVVTVFVSGEPSALSAGTDQIAAESTPLPTELAGISVAIRQSGPSPCADSDEVCQFIPGEAIAAPIFSVERVNLCIDPAQTAADCRATAVTLQIPAELAGSELDDEPYQAIHDLTELVVVKDGVESRPFRLNLLVAGIHILNACDNDRTVRREVFCAPVAAHADGSIITADNPARFGETVVLYAYGLGATNPAVPSGAATPSPGPQLGSSSEGSLPRNLTVYFDRRANAAPENPTASLIANTEPEQVFSPGTSWVGLTPGYIGLYQINVPIPAELPQVFATCGDSVHSNLTINVANGAEFDGAAICIDPESHPVAL